MKQNKIYLIFGMFLLFSITFVNAIPPELQDSDFPQGYTIHDQSIRNIDLNQEFRYGFILENSSTGSTITDNHTTCRLITSNSNGLDTSIYNITYRDEYDLWGISFENPKDNFSEGRYNFLTHCNNDIGGAKTTVFEFQDKTILNIDLDNNTYLILFLVFLALSVLMYFLKYTLFSGFMLIVSGFLTLSNILILGVFLILIGVVIIFKGGDD